MLCELQVGSCILLLLGSDACLPRQSRRQQGASRPYTICASWLLLSPSLCTNSSRGCPFKHLCCNARRMFTRIAPVFWGLVVLCAGICSTTPCSELHAILSVHCMTGCHVLMMVHHVHMPVLCHVHMRVLCPPSNWVWAGELAALGQRGQCCACDLPRHTLVLRCGRCGECHMRCAVVCTVCELVVVSAITFREPVESTT